MIRVLTILAVIAAFAVSASPVSASSGESTRGVLDTGMFEHQWVKGHKKAKVPRAVVVLIGANDYGLTQRQGQKKAKAPHPDVKGFFLDIGTAERLDL